MKYLTIVVVFSILCICSVTANPKKENNINSRVVKALELMDKGKYRDASVLLDEALSEDPNNLMILYNAAYCELYNGRPDISNQHIYKILKVNKNDADVHNLQGLAFERLGMTDSALKAYGQCIKLENNYYEAYYNRGKCYITLNRTNEAISDFKVAKRSKIINPDLYLSSGELYFKLKMFDSAIADFSKIRREMDSNMQYLGLFGDAFYQKLMFDSAAKYYSKVIGLDSESVYALNNRAMCYDKLSINTLAAEDRERIAVLQKKYGIDPTSLKYNVLNSDDGFFSIEVPMDWRSFVRKNDDFDEIIFFNPQFSNEQQGNIYLYQFGGCLSYKPKLFIVDTNNTLKNLEMRDDKFNEFRLQREEYRKKSYHKLSTNLRKTFNANDDNARELIKFSYYDAETKIEFSCLEYYIVSTTGELLDLMLWLPLDNNFQFEALFDYIQQSLTVK